MHSVVIISQHYTFSCQARTAAWIFFGLHQPIRNGCNYSYNTKVDCCNKNLLILKYFFRTLSGCSVVCLQNQDTCTAFQFSNQVWKASTVCTKGLLVLYQNMILDSFVYKTIYKNVCKICWWNVYQNCRLGMAGPTIQVRCHERLLSIFGIIDYVQNLSSNFENFAIFIYKNIVSFIQKYSPSLSNNDQNKKENFWKFYSKGYDCFEWGTFYLLIADFLTTSVINKEIKE